MLLTALIAFCRLIKGSIAAYNSNSLVAFKINHEINWINIFDEFEPTHPTRDSDSVK